VKYEELLAEVLEKPDFLCESGSHLYGMNTPESDYDLRGFTMPPIPYLIGVVNFKAAELEGDTKIYSLKHFLGLVMKGDPQCTELFFASEKNIVECSELGKEVMNLKGDLISNAIYGRIMGYSTGEWRKAMAIKVVPTKWKKEKHEVINDIRNKWQPDKASMDSIIKILEDLDETKTVSSMAQLGAKRKADIEKYGFCRKSAAHSIRLVKQLTELMLDGTMTFPRPDAKLLLSIRNGEYTKEQLEVMHDDVVATAEAARSRSVLPDKPNEKKVWETYYKLTMDMLFTKMTNV
jgi:hypothetical protein